MTPYVNLMVHRASFVSRQAVKWWGFGWAEFFRYDFPMINQHQEAAENRDHQ